MTMAMISNVFLNLLTADLLTDGHDRFITPHPCPSPWAEGRRRASLKQSHFNTPQILNMSWHFKDSPTDF